MSNSEAVLAAIHKVEHPEIAMSLFDLGMLSDIKVEDDGAEFTLLIPFMGIPDVIRDMMIGSVQAAIEENGAELKNVKVDVMSDEVRQAFFNKEQSHWRS